MCTTDEDQCPKGSLSGVGANRLVSVDHQSMRTAYDRANYATISGEIVGKGGPRVTTTNRAWAASMGEQPCIFRNGWGGQCGATAEPGSLYCAQHNPTRVSSADTAGGFFSSIAAMFSGSAPKAPPADAVADPNRLAIKPLGVPNWQALPGTRLEQPHPQRQENQGPPNFGPDTKYRS
jgi:hypothetical protein